MHWKRKKKTRASKQGWQSQTQQFCKNEIEIKQIILKSILLRLFVFIGTAMINLNPQLQYAEGMFG